MEFTCESCGHSILVHDSSVGKRAKCPKCNKINNVLATVYPTSVNETGCVEEDIGFGLTEFTKVCPFCGEMILEAAKKCKHCGEFLEERNLNNLSTTLRTSRQENPNSLNINFNNDAFDNRRNKQRARGYKTKTSAALWCFFLGGVGAHHFYLGNTVRGILYLLFCWIYIPALLSLIDLIVILCTNEERFDEKYN
jgi:TM2 domain-containing membrane protein YozV/predicted RNA-binding Zn-ribbon protein involved in translation (DUF1610 family)